MDPSNSSPSQFVRRLARAVFLIVLCSAALYMYLFASNYENNILVFLANVFAPALLALSFIVTVASESLNFIRRRKPLLDERLISAVLIATFALPTVTGEIRSRPHREAKVSPSQSTFTVLDANLLGSKDVSSSFYDEVARLQPDIITLQELNPKVADSLSARLGADYRCQALEPQPGVFGMGVFAKFPCMKRHSSGFRAGIGIPQIVDVQLPNTKTIGVINIHTIPPHTLIKHHRDDNELRQLSNAIDEREAYVEGLIQASRMTRTDAVILAGDLNATTRNRVYRLVREKGLFDAFASGSRLRGGTWPGPDFPLPPWLIRIDFIFHCAGLISLSAQTLPEGYGSDHRGVFTTLGFTEK